MKLQKKLEKLGIKVIGKIEDENTSHIAHYTANILTKTFPFLQEQYNEILAKVLNLNIYYAEIPNDMSRANYIYEDNCIYIAKDLNLINLDEQLIHEIIHYLQIKRDKKEKIVKMGICKFQDFSVIGLGIDEGIIQYMSSKIIGKEKEEVSVYGVTLKTVSPDNYPMLTNLSEQLIYLLGEEEIIESTIRADEKFENTFYNTFEEKATKILKDFDKILELKNKKYFAKSKQEILSIEKQLNSIYINVQDTMLSKYYDKKISTLKTMREVDYCLEKFEHNKDIIGRININRKSIL